MNETTVPTAQQFREELLRERHKHEYGRTLRGILYVLLVVAAVAVLAAMLWLPVFQVTGNSMEPTLSAGEIVLVVRGAKTKQGDVVAFYYNNKVLIKREIGASGQWINIDKNGNVSVNGKTLTEPYVYETNRGQCDIAFPYQVPDGRYFMMGDHRRTSLDSRSSTIGPIAQEQVIGKVVARIWPLSKVQLL